MGEYEDTEMAPSLRAKARPEDNHLIMASDVPEQSAPRVLVTDDDAGVRLLAVAALEPLGVEVQEAGDGAEAVALFHQRPADLVLLDVRMPRMDGFTACAELRALPHGAEATIIMITGLDDHVSIHQAYDAGATDFITKPINWAILTQRVRYLLRAQVAFRDLRESEARLSEAQRIASLGHWEWDVERDVLRWSDQIYRIFGLPTRSFGANLQAFMARVHPGDRDRIRQSIRRSLEERIPYSVDHRILLPDGSERIVHEQAELRHNPDGRPVKMVGTVHDITERVRAEDRIHRLAYYDELTGLPNRHLFRELARTALEQARRAGARLALLHLDLDRFSRINESLGHDRGDRLLQAVSERLTQSLRRCDLLASSHGDMTSPLARLGADEFLILVADLEHPEAAGHLARRLLADLTSPRAIDTHSHLITASLGIALFPDDASDLDGLLRAADSALHHVKQAGGDDLHFYAAGMNEQAERRLSLEVRLHRALEQEELEIYYQPQTDARNGRLVGLEALLRWFPKGGEQVPPDEFIPVAEETGLIVTIGEWVVRSACAQIAAWQRAGLLVVPVAVNISARQFSHPELVESIRRALADHAVDPALLELELTEGLIMRDAEATRRRLWTLKEAGVRLAVDDFGTGYSSMSYLKRFPLDVLKVDRSFVQDLSSDPTDAAIVRAIVALGQGLELTTLAEGVETDAQQQALVRLGCDRIQGFLFSPPLPAAKVLRFLRPVAQ
jgi:diguanylate cyclase (GGDEF)-like protein/PAS domain S-box-containing protein